MSDKEKQSLADSIYLITYPMLASKKEFIEKLLDLLSGFVDIKEMMKDITLQNLAAMAGDKLKALYLSFPPEKLKNSTWTKAPRFRAAQSLPA